MVERGNMHARREHSRTKLSSAKDQIETSWKEKQVIAVYFGGIVIARFDDPIGRLHFR